MQLSSRVRLAWQKILRAYLYYLSSLIPLAQDFIVLMQLKSRLGLVWQKILFVFVDYLVNLLRSSQISQQISPLQGKLFYLIALT